MERKLSYTFAAVFAVSLLSSPASAQDSTVWDWGVELYGWLPDIEGTAANGAEIDLPIDDILDNLDFTLQGTVFATRGDWSIFADAVYLDLGASEGTKTSRPIGRFGRVDIGVDADVDLTTFISTVGGGYRFHQSKSTDLNVIGGLRYAYMDVEIDADVDGNAEVEILGREFSREFKRSLDLDESETNWDAIIGLQGTTKINENWSLLYYGDIGTGDSDYTWQIAAGVSYAFENFDVTLRYRHMEYQFDDNSAIDELTISGPQIGVRFKF